MKNYLIFFGGLFLALLAHDAQLYPHLEAMDLVTLAILRIALLLIPLIGMTMAMRAKTKTPQFITGLLLWCIFVPYTI